MNLKNKSGHSGDLAQNFAQLVIQIYIKNVFRCKECGAQVKLLFQDNLKLAYHKLVSSSKVMINKIRKNFYLSC
jgi:hypothetical protein